MLAKEKSTEVGLSELLCFVHNKMDVFPQKNLNKTITDFYSNFEVRMAKNLLHNRCAHIFPLQWKTKRSGSGKCSRNT